jgi:hypothetical protein
MRCALMRNASRQIPASRSRVTCPARSSRSRTIWRAAIGSCPTETTDYDHSDPRRPLRSARRAVREGPRVRIQLPPAESLLRTGLSRRTLPGCGLRPFGELRPVIAADGKIEKWVAAKGSASLAARRPASSLYTRQSAFPPTKDRVSTRSLIGTSPSDILKETTTFGLAGSFLLSSTMN